MCEPVYIMFHLTTVDVDKLYPRGMVFNSTKGFLLDEIRGKGGFTLPQLCDEMNLIKSFEQIVANNEHCDYNPEKSFRRNLKFKEGCYPKYLFNEMVYENGTVDYISSMLLAESTEIRNIGSSSINNCTDVMKAVSSYITSNNIPEGTLFTYNVNMGEAVDVFYYNLEGVLVNFCTIVFIEARGESFVRLSAEGNMNKLDATVMYTKKISKGAQYVCF